MPIFTDNPPEDGTHYQTSSIYRLADSTLFHRITNVQRADCAQCGSPVRGNAWGSRHHVMHEGCATRYYRAGIRASLPDQVLSPNFEDEDEEESPVMIKTKQDRDFLPSNYKSIVLEYAVRGKHGCCALRCPLGETRFIARGTLVMIGPKYHSSVICMPCFNKLKDKADKLPPRVRCARCEQHIPLSDATQLLTDGYICRICRDSYYCFAEGTDGGWIAADDAIQISGSAIIASREYAEEHWFLGPDSQWYLTEEAAEHARDRAHILYTSRQLAAHRSSDVFSYGTNVISMLGWPKETKRESLCFGVELEMVPKEFHTRSAVVGSLGTKYVEARPYILCADSSLGDGGVELITLPFTLTQHKANSVPWESLLAAARDVAMSGKGTSVCGMHVHINRKALSSFQLGKMLVIINAPEMQQLICCVAQRAAIRYCGRKLSKIKDIGKGVNTHFDALNTDTKKGTAELRIFRGNLRLERVMKNLEFTHALCQYAGEQSMQQLIFPKLFVTWIYARRGIYPNLADFIANHYKENGLLIKPELLQIMPVDGDI